MSNKRVVGKHPALGAPYGADSRTRKAQGTKLKAQGRTRKAARGSARFKTLEAEARSLLAQAEVLKVRLERQAKRRQEFMLAFYALVERRPLFILLGFAQSLVRPVIRLCSRLEQRIWDARLTMLTPPPLPEEPKEEAPLSTVPESCTEAPEQSPGVSST